MSELNKEIAIFTADQHRLAMAIRDACLESALQAYEDAGFAGLCHEGAWEVAIDAIRSLDVETILASIAATKPQSDDAGN